MLKRIPTLILAQRCYSTSPSTTAHPLQTQLRSALKSSMLARTQSRTGVIKYNTLSLSKHCSARANSFNRSLLADLQTASHTGGSPPSPYKTLALSISRRLDAAQTFRSSSPPRTDLADQYEGEVEILKEFAPKKPEAMSKQQLESVVREVIDMCELKRVEGKDTGRVIKLVRERVGDRAEGKDISEAVKQLGSA